MPTFSSEREATYTYSDIVFVAPESMANRIDRLEPGELISTADLLRNDMWEAISDGERRALENFIETVVVEELVPLERVYFHGDDRKFYRKMDS